MRFLALSVLMISLGRADSDSIKLNGVDLKIGMEKSTVLDRLRFGSDLEDRSSPAQGIYIWRVRSKLTGSEGSVQFIDDRLVRGNVEKGDAEGEAAAVLVGRLYSALKEAEGSGEKFRFESEVSLRRSIDGDGVRSRSLRFAHIRVSGDPDIEAPVSLNSGRGR